MCNKIAQLEMDFYAERKHFEMCICTLLEKYTNRL